MSCFRLVKKTKKHYNTLKKAIIIGIVGSWQVIEKKRCMANQWQEKLR